MFAGLNTNVQEAGFEPSTFSSFFDSRSSSSIRKLQPSGGVLGNRDIFQCSTWSEFKKLRSLFPSNFLHLNSSSTMRLRFVKDWLQRRQTIESIVVRLPLNGNNVTLWFGPDKKFNKYWLKNICSAVVEVEVDAVQVWCCFRGMCCCCLRLSGV